VNAGDVGAYPRRHGIPVVLAIGMKAAVRPSNLESSGLNGTTPLQLEANHERGPVEVCREQQMLVWVLSSATPA
jgi:hypothetical protein